MWIQSDHETLDTREAGTWSHLSQAHRDLMPGPTFSFGLPNMFGPPLYPFPAAFPVGGLGTVSDALLGGLNGPMPC